jgi:seryl-tRNA synthetase
MNVDVSPSFASELLQAGLLIPMGSDGLYARSGLFESVVAGLDVMAGQLGADLHAERLSLPPAMSRAAFEQAGYMASFPQLAGTVHCFCGDEAHHRRLVQKLESHEDWTGEQTASDVVLTPAACYPVYPIIASRGKLPRGGHVVNVTAWCFRREPSRDPTRMQMFQMHEFVRLGTEAEVTSFRAAWVQRALGMAEHLVLPARIEVANDPFFGHAGKMMAASQVEQALKLELTIPVSSDETPTACMSFNNHRDKFGATWDIRTSDDTVAHTACVGFGLERLALALFRHHGLAVSAWPVTVRDAIGL